MRGTPETGADEFDGGEIVFRAPVIAGGDAAELLDPVPGFAPPDKPVVAGRGWAIAFGYLAPGRTGSKP